MSNGIERDLRDVVATFPRPEAGTANALEARVVAVSRRRRRPARGSVVRGLTVVAALVAAFLVGTTSSATGDAGFGDAGSGPTLAVRKYQIANLTYVDLTGRIPSDKAGEYVEILERECGSQYFRISMGSSTARGGFWEKREVMFFDPATYVARWNGRLSDEVMVRSPLSVSTLRVRGRRFDVLVSTQQRMAGRTVVLQRRTADDSWIRVRAFRLRQRSFGSYVARFVVPTRGLMLRVLVPQASARPCHDASVSATFSS